MDSLYNFLTGWPLWLCFIFFIGGLIARGAFLYGLSREADKIFYDHFEGSWAWASIGRWLIPLGSVSLRNQPVLGLVFFVFHVCLIGVPLFLGAHNIMWQETFGWRLFILPNELSDALTIVVMACAAYLLIRRIVQPHVRILSSLWDYILIILVAAPFVTGFLAYHQVEPYATWMTLHVLFGEIMLVIIPFSKLGHLMLFFFTRASLGVEMGARREKDGRLGAKVW